METSTNEDKIKSMLSKRRNQLKKDGVKLFWDNHVEINSEVWAELLTDRKVSTESDINVLRIVYESKNYEIRGGEIALKLGISHHGSINLQIGRFSKRIVAKTRIQPPLGKDGSGVINWWHILFLFNVFNGVTFNGVRFTGTFNFKYHTVIFSAYQKFLLMCIF